MKFSAISTGLLATIASAAVIDDRAVKGCNRDNFLRCLVGTPALAIPFCSSAVGIFPVAPTATTTFVPTAAATVTVAATTTEQTQVTVLTTRTIIFNVIVFGKDKRAPAPSSLACVAKLQPDEARISSACSCFSAEYQPSLTPQTVTATAQTLTATVATVTDLTTTTSVGTVVQTTTTTTRIYTTLEEY